MATTTNYGWTTPDDTALVKDGASAIRTLGSSVDTTTKNLNPETTLGDIAYRSSSANVKTRLGIGSTGNVLTVSGGVPVWAAPAGGGAYTSLATGTLSGTSVTISSISQSYIHLYLRIIGAQASTGRPALRLNNSSSSVYSNLGANIDSVTWGSDGNKTSFLFGTDLNTTDTARTHTYEINLYTETCFKPVFLNSRYGTSDGGQCMWRFGNFNDSTAVSSLVIFNSDGASFAAGAYVLYGVK